MKAKIVQSISELDPKAWDRLTDPHFPFLDYDFLKALEVSGCIGGDSGWLPRFICVYGEDNGLLAAVPFFLKLHSFGEFLYDFSWAEAYAANHIPYYPKLIAAAPLTPATGSRLLLAPSIGLDPVLPAINQALNALAKTEAAHSVNFLFCREAEADLLAKNGFHKRISWQAAWHNRDYQIFEHFLSTLTAKRRNEIRRERRQVSEAGLVIRTITGPEISEADLDACWRCYEATHDKYGSPGHLNRAFFLEAGKHLANRLLLFIAERDERPVGASFNLMKGRQLFGRYWGCLEPIRSLHFELCYYRLIDYAIEHGFTRLEAGAGGEHKIPRGLEPELIFGAHKFRHPGFHQAIGDYLTREKVAVLADQSREMKRLPFGDHQ